jgi:hypothetical protein
MTIPITFDGHYAWGHPTRGGNYAHRPYAEVIVTGPAGYERIWCLIDTGADFTILDDAVVTNIGATYVGPHPISGVGGSVTLEEYSGIDLEVESKKTTGRTCLFGTNVGDPLLGRGDVLSTIRLGFDRKGWLYKK